MAKAKPFTYTKRGRPSKADIAARKKAERQEGSKRFDRLEAMLWAVYPFIVGTVILARFI